MANRARVTIDPQTEKAVAKLVLTFVLPLLILADLFGLIFTAKSGDSSFSEIAGFGRLGKGKARSKAAETSVTFADVAGQDHVVVELAEVIDYLKEPARFQAVGATAPRWVQLPSCEPGRTCDAAGQRHLLRGDPGDGGWGHLVRLRHPLVTTTAAADTGVVLASGVVYASGATGSWVTGVSPNSSYGPVNFLYSS